MGKANFWYNARDKRWELRNRSGVVSAFWHDDGYAQDEGGRVTKGIGTITDARIVRAMIGGGATLSMLTKNSGTLASVAVGTGLNVLGTLTGMGSAAIAVGDLIFLNAKIPSLGNVLFGGGYIPTTNVVNVFLNNLVLTDVGSIPHTGVDVYRVRF